MSRLHPDPWQPTTNKLDLAVLGKMAEELGECTSATNRCIIQGIDEREPETGKLNREWLSEEIADVIATANTAIEHFCLDPLVIYARVDRKMEHFAGWHALLSKPVDGAAEHRAVAHRYTSGNVIDIDCSCGRNYSIIVSQKGADPLGWTCPEVGAA